MCFGCCISIWRGRARRDRGHVGEAFCATAREHDRSRAWACEHSASIYHWAWGGGGNYAGHHESRAKTAAASQCDFNTETLYLMCNMLYLPRIECQHKLTLLQQIAALYVFAVMPRSASLVHRVHMFTARLHQPFLTKACGGIADLSSTRTRFRRAHVGAPTHPSALLHLDGFWGCRRCR